MRADRASGISVCLSLRSFVHPSSCLILVGLSVCLSVCASVHSSVRPPVRSSVSRSRDGLDDSYRHSRPMDLVRSTHHTSNRESVRRPHCQANAQSRCPIVLRYLQYILCLRDDVHVIVLKYVLIHLHLGSPQQCIVLKYVLIHYNQSCPRAAAEKDKEVQKHQSQWMTTTTMQWNRGCAN